MNIFRTVFSLVLLVTNSSLLAQHLEIEGDIDVRGNKISNVADPTLDQDAVTKAYVDNILLNFGISLGSTGIQGLLNADYSPLDIIAAGASIDSLYGKVYQGGYIFYLDVQDTIQGIKGLVSSPTDQSDQSDWGCMSYDLPDVPNVSTLPPSGPGSEIGDGITNTAAILSIGNCRTALAANLCNAYQGAGFRDWFLPSIQELDLMWKNLADSDRDNNNSGPTDPNNLGNFDSQYYWSSSESSDRSVWVQYFKLGGQYGALKDNIVFHVRAIRAF